METLASLQLDFMRLALVVGVLLAGTCAWVGVFLVLRRMVFAGAALAEVAAAGLALGCLIVAAADLHGGDHAADQWVTVGTSLLVTLAAVVLFWRLGRQRILSRESLIGWAWAAAVAAAVLLVAVNPGGELHDVDILSGNLLFLRPRDLTAVLLALPGVWLVHALLRKELVFASFDPDAARTLGLHAERHDLLLHLSVGVTIAVGMRLTGVLFIFSSLVVPPVVGLLLARRLAGAGLVAVAAAALSVVAGLLLSYRLDLPTGPAIVAVQAALVPPAALVRRLRGHG